MSFLISAFNAVLYQPLFNVLVLLYNYIPGNDFGIAIIILTIFIRILFYSLNTKSIKSQKALSDIQPKIKEIQEKYKQDKEKQTKELMELYKKEKINPFSGCLPLLVQLPVLIALYRVFWRGFQPEQMVFLYSFVPRPEVFATTFLGIINLANPNVIIAVLAGIFQFFQTKMSTPKLERNKKRDSSLSGQMQKQMLYFMPIFTVLILFKLPSAIGVYWITTTLFTILQQYFILKNHAYS